LNAALWGVPGPVIVGCFIAIGCGAFFYPGRDHDLTAYGRETLGLGLIPLAEGALGVMFGLLRGSTTAFAGKRRYLNLVHGALIGTLIWCLAGGPYLIIAAFAAVIALGYGRLDLFGLILGISLGHIFAGAIAGFHVEYYLMHGREREDIVS
jgi:hypothetical protein